MSSSFCVLPQKQWSWYNNRDKKRWPRRENACQPFDREEVKAYALFYHNCQSAQPAARTKAAANFVYEEVALMKVNINSIQVNDGRRRLNRERVAEIAESIQTVGLLNPVTVTRDNVLVAGAHRW